METERRDDAGSIDETEHSAGSPGGNPASTLRRLLQANGVFSLATGAIATVAAGSVAEFLGIDQTWLVRTVGIGLLVFALSLFVTARQSPAVLKAAAPAISAGDVCWVMATVAVVALGWLSTSGALVMAAIGVLVLVFGVEQFVTGRRIAV